MAQRERDFNHIKEWLQKKLNERKLSISRLSVLTKTVTPATIYRWNNDTFRPTPEKLLLVCKVLSEVPIQIEGEPPRLEEVPLREAMAQFTERLR